MSGTPVLTLCVSWKGSGSYIATIPGDASTSFDYINISHFNVYSTSSNAVSFGKVGTIVLLSDRLGSTSRFSYSTGLSKPYVAYAELSEEQTFYRNSVTFNSPVAGQKLSQLGKIDLTLADLSGNFITMGANDAVDVIITFCSRCSD